MRLDPRSPLRSLGLAALLGLLVTARAEAYLDPGTGSYMLQMLVAGGLAVAYALRTYWDALFGRGEPEDDGDEDEEAPDDPEDGAGEGVPAGPGDEERPAP